MPVSEPPHLRVLIANERRDRAELLTSVVTGLGHRVIACESGIETVAEVTVQERPDVALIGLGVSSDAALELIEQIVRGSACPVIAMLATEEPRFVREAARRGVFAYIVDTALDDIQGTIDITLQRFAEFQNLQGAFGRRAILEQAKGILMARHVIDADAAFGMLRQQSQSSGRKVGDVAAAVVDSHMLLTPRPVE